MSPTYAATEDFEAYVPGWTTSDEPALEALLERAEEYIDNAVGRWPRDVTTGRKFIPARLTTVQAMYLTRATCAQAEYMLEMGEDFFRAPALDENRGPDFTETGKIPHLGPKARMELSNGGLFRLAGRHFSVFPRAN